MTPSPTLQLALIGEPLEVPSLPPKLEPRRVSPRAPVAPVVSLSIARQRLRGVKSSRNMNYGLEADE